MAKMFLEGEKVLYLPEDKIYDFGYLSSAPGKAVIYEEGERNMQDSFVVELDQLRKYDGVIINGRIVNDITFATRFKSFLKDIQVNDPMSQEELEYFQFVADKLVKHQRRTAETEDELDYLKRVG